MGIAFKRPGDALTGVLVAIAATLIINLPLWHGLATTDEWARPDVVNESSDEEFYLTRVREVADGHPSIGHPYVYERRDQRYPLGNLFEVILGTAMRVLHLDIKTMSLAGDAFFPFVLVLILWNATKHVLPEKRWRLLLVGILFLGFEMTWWKRPVSPQALTVLPLLWLWAAFSPRAGTFGLTALRGALIGLMLLSYPFHWTYCLVAEAFFLLMQLRNDPDWSLGVKRFLILVVPLVIIGSPWIIGTLNMSGNAAYAETLERLGLIDRRFPSGLPLQVLLVASMVMILLAARKTGRTHTAQVLMVLLVSGLVVLNQPLLTGKEAEFSSHYRQILFFPLWIAVLAAIRSLLNNKISLSWTITLLGLCVVGIHTIQATDAQWNIFEERRTAFETREKRMRIMDELSKLPGQQHIVTDDDVAWDLTVYTPHYPYFRYETYMYLMDNDTLWDRAAVQRSIYSGAAIQPRALIGSSYQNRALHAATICRFQNIFRRSKEPCTFPSESFLPERWRFFVESQPLQPDIVLQKLSDAQIGYVMLKNIPEWLTPHLTPVTEIEGYQLMRFARALRPNGE